MASDFHYIKVLSVLIKNNSGRC